MTRSLRFPPLRATALAATLLGCIGTAQAAASAEQLAAIKLYGDITIAQDRVDQWGPWEEFEPPAAGPLGYTAANLQFRREAYRPLATPDDATPAPPSPQPELVARLCEAGSLCGYGVQGLINGDLREDTPTSLQIVTVDRSNVENADGSPSRPALSLQLDRLPLPATTTIDPLLALDNSDTLFANEPFTSFAWLTLSEDGVPEGYNLLLTRYVEGRGDVSPYQQFAGVVGRVTSTADMAELRSTAMQATYAGWDQAAPNGVRGAVNIRVDFGAGTFNYATEGGVQSYQAQGVIRGSGYVATSFITPNTSGTLQGNFIGSNAAGTVGGASVTQNGVTANTIHATRRVIEEVPR